MSKTNKTKSRKDGQRMNRIRKKLPYFDYILIIVGTAIMALAINSIFDPNAMVMGGFSGLAIIIKSVTGQIIEGGIPLWITNIVLNIPLFLLGIRIKGARFMVKSIVGAVALTVWLAVIPIMEIVHDDFVLASLYGGVIMGVGIGLVFLGNGTTGGTDTVAALVQHYLKQYSIPQVMQIVDAMIVVLGAFVFGVSKAMYAIIAIFIVTKISDGIIEGVKYSKGVYIITNEQEKMSQAILYQIERGLTGIDVRGMYSNVEKYMLFCVVSKKQIVELKEVVTQVDPRAFIIISDVREVLGEGFVEEVLR